MAVVLDEAGAADLKRRLPAGFAVDIQSGDAGYRAAAAMDGVDMVVTAVVGAAGLLPTLAAIDAGKDIALANKETLVMAGELVMGRAAAKGVRILPVDSEHSAIFQCLAGQAAPRPGQNPVDRIRAAPFAAFPPSGLAHIRRRGRTGPSDLADGPQDYHRLGHLDEQRPGGHRSPLAFRRRTG